LLHAKQIGLMTLGSAALAACIGTQIGEVSAGRS